MDNLPDSVLSLSDLLRHMEGHATRPENIADALRELLHGHPEAEAEAGSSWYWELAAGTLIHTRKGEWNPWGLDFGPLLQSQSEDGEPISVPMLERLKPGAVEYWRGRSRTTANPHLGSHYADLAWSFASHLGADKPIEDACRAIDQYIEASRIEPNERAVDAIQALQRAMTLSLSVKDSVRQTNVKGAMFDLARQLEETPKPLYRSFLLESFGLGPFTKVTLAADETDYMVHLLEDVLEREAIDPDPETVTSVWDAENAAQILTAYYRKLNQPGEVRRVLETFGSIVHRRALKAQPMAGQAWLGGYSRLAKEHGQTDLEVQAVRALQALGSSVVKDLKEVGGSISIPTKVIDEIIHDFVRGDLDQDLSRLAGGFIPVWDEVVAGAHEAASNAPFSSLATKMILDRRGRPTVYLPAFYQNPSPHYPSAYAQRVQCDGVIRRLVISALLKTHGPSAARLADWLVRSPAFPEDRRGFLEHGLSAFVQGDWVAAIHVLLPQIEEALRQLGYLLGDRTSNWETSSDGIRRLDVRALHAVLDGPGLIGCFGVDVISFFKATLVQQQGLNLRNRMAHGLLYPEECTPYVADVVFQALLIPGLARTKDPGHSTPAPGSAVPKPQE